MDRPTSLASFKVGIVFVVVVVVVDVLVVVVVVVVVVVHLVTGSSWIIVRC